MLVGMMFDMCLMHVTCMFAAGNGVGDVCEMDSDGDGVLDGLDTDGDKVLDSLDSARNNKFIKRAGFTRHMLVPLSSGPRPVSPRWTVTANVRTTQN